MVMSHLVLEPTQLCWICNPALLTTFSNIPNQRKKSLIVRVLGLD